MGTLARIRPSSVIVSPSSGTLRSDRTRTRLPRDVPEVVDCLIATVTASEPTSVDEVDEAVGVAPLVVVPADDLDLVADDLGQPGVEDARRRVGDDVAGDDRVLGVAQVALQRAVGRAALNAALTSSTVVSRETVDGEVGGRAGGDRHAHREAVELALELGQHQGDGLGRAGAGRHDVERGGAGAAQVLVRAVQEVLVVGVGVDRGHQARARSSNVSCSTLAIGARQLVVHDAFEMIVVLRRVVVAVVDAQHDGDVLVLGRRRDDDLLGAAVDVRPGLGGVGEEAGRLDDDVGAELLPRQRRRVALLEHLDACAADDDVLVVVGHVLVAAGRGWCRT